VKATAQALLRQHWSPEQIAGRWRYEGSRRISFVTLYRWIRKEQKAGGDPCNQKRHYAHGYGRKAYTQCIPEPIGVEQGKSITPAQKTERTDLS